jgi:hypothetical protein
MLLYRSWLIFIARLIPWLALVATDSVSAQAAAAQMPSLLSDAEVAAKYQNCPGGWYSGPRPGKARFARDPWKWVVSAEFAKRFCMPEEFVSTELKGAEAVAFRLMRKGDEENCGFGGNPDACWGETVLRFEVYIRSDARVPRRHDGLYYQAPKLPSGMLISGTSAEQDARLRLLKVRPDPALKPPLEVQQVGLHGVKDGVIVWPITSLGLETYFAAVFEGNDYYAFEGLTGFFENPGIKKNNVTRFFINFAKLGEKGMTNKGVLLSDKAHTIELPEAFTDAVVDADLTKGRNVRAQLDQAFKPKTPLTK